MPFTLEETKILDSIYSTKAQTDEILDKREFSTKRVYCESCKKLHDEQYAETLRIYWHEKNKIMLERAIKILEGQVLNIYDYKKAFDAVTEFVREKEKEAENNPEAEYAAFDSSDEVATAVVLLTHGIKVRVHRKIGKHEVDFILPSLRVALEIDGEFFHKGKEKRENRRDVEVRNMLGSEWEVVRIPTKYINQNIEMLPDRIKREKAEKQRIRKIYGGVLPPDYPKRDVDYTV